MGNYSFSAIIIFLVLFGCDTSKKEPICIPMIIIESNKDTLLIGETYKATISLSDESVLTMERNDREELVLPLFRINGKVYESESNKYVYEVMVNSSKNGSSNFREWSVGIIFPHPVWGDVEISQRHGYYVKEP